jgi:anthranilate phosphoribosyltransferase
LRREIGFRTFFNLLGVLLNPAEPKYQLIGVAEPAVLRLYRYFLENSGRQFALVHSRDGYDEISLTAAFDIVSNGNAETFYPEDLGFQTIGTDELGGGETIEKAAKQFLQILQNESTTTQKMVVTANAAMAMQLANPEMSFDDCRHQSEKSLNSGAAFEAFNNWKSVE